MSLQVIDWPQFLESHDFLTQKAAMTIGVFDGVHLGHQELIKRIVRRGPNPTVITFRENPKKVVSLDLWPSDQRSGDSYEGDIFSLKQKLTVFERLGVSRVVLIDFSEKFSKLLGREFIDLLSDGMAFLAIGSNFRCGYRQSTGAEEIKEMNKRKGVPTEVVPPVETGTALVSSSRIRSAIIRGDLSLARALMGRNLEVDLSDFQPIDLQSGTMVYDFRAIHRTVPPAGEYNVLLFPGASRGRVIVKEGKVLLGRDQSKAQVEYLEFLID